jgi:hypothetical protein
MPNSKIFLSIAGITLISLGLFTGFQQSTIIIIHLIKSATNLNPDPVFWGHGLQYISAELIILGLFCIIQTVGIGLKPAAITGLVLLSALFGFRLFTNTLNVPIMDDFRSVLIFFHEFDSAADITERIQILTAHHTESRFITLRVIVLMLHQLTGEVNLKHIILLANLAIPLMAFLLYKCGDRSLWQAAFILLMLLHFSWYDSMIWATNAVAYQITALASLSTFFLAFSSQKKHQLLSIITALIAVCTFGNGMLVLPITAAGFMIRKDFRKALAWIFFTLATAYFYFSDNLTGTKLPDILNLIVFVFSFTGSAFQFLYSTPVTALAGLLIWTAAIYLTIRRYYQKNFPVWALLVFILLSAVIAGIYRSQNGPHEAVSGRYAYFSILAIICTISALSDVSGERFQKHLKKYSLTSAIVFHLLCGVFFYPEVTTRNNKLRKYIADIKNEKPVQNIEPVIQFNADEIIKESMKKGFYKP